MCEFSNSAKLLCERTLSDVLERFASVSALTNSFEVKSGIESKSLVVRSALVVVVVAVRIDAGVRVFVVGDVETTRNALESVAVVVVVAVAVAVAVEADGDVVDNDDDNVVVVVVVVVAVDVAVPLFGLL